MREAKPQLMSNNKSTTMNKTPLLKLKHWKYKTFNRKKKNPSQKLRIKDKFQLISPWNRLIY